MSELRGPDGLRWELGLSSAKNMIRGCLQDYNAGGIIPLKPSIGRLNIIKALGIIRNYPFKTLKPLKEGGPRKTWVVPI
jgi:hypothetical protein